jgi:DNA-binding CsgD family transcriptional regulator
MESSERYQAIVAALEVMETGVCITDARGRVFHENAVLRRQLSEGSLALEQAIADARQAAIDRTRDEAGGAGHASSRRPRVSVQLRTDAARYEVEAVAADGDGIPAARFVVVMVRDVEARRMNSDARHALGELTAREKRVAALVGGGIRTREIAHALGISVHTARRHVEAVLKKLGVHSRADVRQRLND